MSTSGRPIAGTTDQHAATVYVEHDANLPRFRGMDVAQVSFSSLTTGSSSHVPSSSGSQQSGTLHVLTLACGSFSEITTNVT